MTYSVVDSVSFHLFFFILRCNSMTENHNWRTLLKLKDPAFIEASQASFHQEFNFSSYSPSISTPLSILSLSHSLLEQACLIYSKASWHSISHLNVSESFSFNNGEKAFNFPIELAINLCVKLIFPIRLWSSFLFWGGLASNNALAFPPLLFFHFFFHVFPHMSCAECC